MDQIPPVIKKLQEAWNAHDVEALRACLRTDYESIQPFHPERNLQGCESAARSWSAIFASAPDLQAELLRWAHRADEVWTEWRWSGAHLSGCAFLAGGVMVLGLRAEQILWARVYTETLSASGPDWDAVLEEILDMERPGD